eukprot:Hpha_TRINITY_DN12310_c0_g1::TRINITY_DN12310_c0_g1_i1::g.155923::m.155923
MGFRFRLSDLESESSPSQSAIEGDTGTPQVSQPPPEVIHEELGSGSFNVVVAETRGHRPEMEDAKVCVTKKGWGMFGVFDGHGGSACSRFVADALTKELEQRVEPYTADGLTELILRLDRDFVTYAIDAKTEAIRDRSGSTGTVAQVELRDGVWEVATANIGDSRTVAVSPEGRAELLTRDHKPSDEAERARIRAAGGWVAGGRVDGQLAVSRAFGDVEYKEGTDPSRQKVIAIPDVRRVACRLGTGGYLVLCCDGMFEGGMSEQDMANLVCGGVTLIKGASAAVEEALLQGSQDNITCLVVRLGDPRQSPSPPPPTRSGSQSVVSTLQQQTSLVAGDFELSRRTELEVTRRTDFDMTRKTGLGSKVASASVAPNTVSEFELTRQSIAPTAASGLEYSHPTLKATRSNGRGSVPPSTGSEPLIVPSRQHADPASGRRQQSNRVSSGVASFATEEQPSPGSRSSPQRRVRLSQFADTGMTEEVRTLRLRADGSPFLLQPGETLSGMSVGLGINGCRVDRVRLDSPAWNAGVRPFMKVVRVSGRLCSSGAVCRRLLQEWEGPNDLKLEMTARPEMWARPRQRKRSKSAARRAMSVPPLFFKNLPPPSFGGGAHLLRGQPRSGGRSQNTSFSSRIGTSFASRGALTPRVSDRDAVFQRSTSRGRNPSPRPFRAP